MLKAGLCGYHAGTGMEHLHMDMLDPLPVSEYGNYYVFLMVNQISKWVEIHDFSDITAEQMLCVL